MPQCFCLQRFEIQSMKERQAMYPPLISTGVHIQRNLQEKAKETNKQIRNKQIDQNYLNVELCCHPKLIFNQERCGAVRLDAGTCKHGPVSLCFMPFWAVTSTHANHLWPYHFRTTCFRAALVQAWPSGYLWFYFFVRLLHR